jgi:hypothetical protein
MNHRESGASFLKEPINKKFLISFILTVGIGAMNFGYSIGVFNSLMFDFLLFVFKVNP